MVAQNCPRCASNRVRHGYRPTPIWAKVLFRYNLLCDSCNWEFRGFAIPGTVSTKSSKKRKKGNSAANTKENNFKSNDKDITDEMDGKSETVEEYAKTDNDPDSVENNKKKNKPIIDSSNQKSEKRVRIKL